jgi:hypothetical protein
VYSAIYEWRNGQKEAIDFTTGAYIDAYDGNVNTLKNMKAEYPKKFEVMMADIYAKVRCVPKPFANNRFLSVFCQFDGGQTFSSNCQHRN